MADLAVAREIFRAVDDMAGAMQPSWDSAPSWAAAADGLVEVIAKHGDALDATHLATLLGTAAMARRCSIGEARDRG